MLVYEAEVPGGAVQVDKRRPEGWQIAWRCEVLLENLVFKLILMRTFIPIIGDGGEINVMCSYHSVAHLVMEF